MLAIAPIIAPVSIPSPSRSVWYLGPFPLRAYALCILAGVFIAVWWTSRRYRARGGSEETVLDAAMLGVPVGILGARLYHVLTSPGAYFGPGGDPARIVQIWRVSSGSPAYRVMSVAPWQAMVPLSVMKKREWGMAWPTQPPMHVSL